MAKLTKNVQAQALTESEKVPNKRTPEMDLDFQNPDLKDVALKNSDEALAQKKMPRRIALLGGSFDPVTSAHEQLVQALSARFDKVVVIPCYISPFKTDADIASSEHRVKMLKKLYDGIENVKVSQWEIKRAKCSYTYKTVSHFAEKYKDDQLYFVIGSDCIERLSEWKNLDVLAKKATFYVVPRPGFSLTQAQIKAANKLVRLEKAPFAGKEGSSSEARVANAFGRVTDMVPESTAAYIQKHDMYQQYRYIIDAYKTFSLKNERIEHTYRATMTGIALAKKHGVSIPDTIVALLLHDIGKYADSQCLTQQGVTVPDEVFSLPEPIQHAPIGAAIAKQYFKVQNDDIILAIETHTTGAAQMSPLQMLVYLADSIEPGRDFPERNQLQEHAFLSLEKGMLAALKNTIDYVSQAEPVFPRTIEAYHAFLRQNQNDAAKTVGIKEKPLKKEENKQDTILADDQSTKAKKATTAKTTAAKATAAKTTAAKTTAADKADSTVATNAVLKKPMTKKPTTKAVKIDAEKEKVQVFADRIALLLSEKKAHDIVIIDLAGKTVIADYFVIASVSSTTAVKALCDYVDEKLSKDDGIEPLRRDVDSKWAAIDYGNVILHVFHEETRSFYQLERLWDNGENVRRI